MTREEAIARILDHMEVHRMGVYPHIKIKEALDLAISALRGPTREMVERLRGEWRTTIDNDCEMYVCSVCGARDVKGLYEYDNPRLYCYHCGAPMTDEAVEMVMERLEALKDGKGV